MNQTLEMPFGTRLPAISQLFRLIEKWEKSVTSKSLEGEGLQQRLILLQEMPMKEEMRSAIHDLFAHAEEPFNSLPIEGKSAST